MDLFCAVYYFIQLLFSLEGNLALLSLLKGPRKVLVGSVYYLAALQLSSTTFRMAPCDPLLAVSTSVGVFVLCRGALLCTDRILAQ